MLSQRFGLLFFRSDGGRGVGIEELLTRFRTTGVTIPEFSELHSGGFPGSGREPRPSVLCLATGGSRLPEQVVSASLSSEGP